MPKLTSAAPSTNGQSSAPKTLLENVLAHFEGARKVGKEYVALCPAHADSKPSLSIGEGDGGKVVLYCHAGCETEDVLQQAGLRMSDLFPPGGRKGGKGPGAPAGKIVAEFDYRDEQGELLYQALRYEPKSFKQRRPDGKGGWVWNMQGVRRVLYRLPELLALRPGSTVFSVEGEGVADLAWDLQIPATTVVGGARSPWLDEYTAALKPHHVVQLPDNDDPGREHVADKLRKTAAEVASTRVLELPGLPDKGDLRDWLEANGWTRDLYGNHSPGATARKRRLREKLLALVEQTQPLPISVIKKISFGPPAPAAATPADAGAGNTVIKINKITPPLLGGAAYYGITGRFLKAVAPYTEATDAGVLAHLLPAVGTLAGPGPHVWAGGKQPARVNAALVGRTNGGRKGTSGVPVNQLMRLVDQKFWERQKVGGLSSGEGLIEFVADKRSKDKDGNELIELVEKRVYVLEEEFSRVLAMSRREGNILSQVIRGAFDSGDLGTLTVHPRLATGAHISIVAHITPEELAARLDSLEVVNGFGNRFLWFYVESDKVMAKTEPIPDKVLSPFAPRLRTLMCEGKEDRPVPMDPAAARRWEEVYPPLRQDHPDLAGAAVARGATMVLRLALTYALLEESKHRGAV
jgi:hypothetical protein